MIQDKKTEEILWKIIAVFSEAQKESQFICPKAKVEANWKKTQIKLECPIFLPFIGRIRQCLKEKFLSKNTNMKEIIQILQKIIENRFWNMFNKPNKLSITIDFLL